jgi:hypothetical protein
MEKDLRDKGLKPLSLFCLKRLQEQPKYKKRPHRSGAGGLYEKNNFSKK